MQIWAQSFIFKETLFCYSEKFTEINKGHKLYHCIVSIIERQLHIYVTETCTDELRIFSYLGLTEQWRREVKGMMQELVNRCRIFLSLNGRGCWMASDRMPRITYPSPRIRLYLILLIAFFFLIGNFTKVLLFYIFLSYSIY